MLNIVLPKIFALFLRFRFDWLDLGACLLCMDTQKHRIGQMAIEDIREVSFEY